MKLDFNLTGNYLFATDPDSSSTQVFQGIASKVQFVKSVQAGFYIIEGMRGIDKTSKFSWEDITLNGVAFADENAFISWYTANTGNFNGGGSAPKSVTFRFNLLSDNSISFTVLNSNGANIIDAVRQNIGIFSFYLENCPSDFSAILTPVVITSLGIMATLVFDEDNVVSMRVTDLSNNLVDNVSIVGRDIKIESYA